MPSGKKIYILLTRSSTFLSRAIYFMTFDRYTHVSISFDDDLGTMYSSARKNGVTAFPAGPCHEGIDRGYYGRHHGMPCILYELEVSEETYERAKQYTENIIRHSYKYHYNLIGVVLCRMGIIYHRKHHYFCSEMISEILMESGAWTPDKDTTLIMPAELQMIPGLRVIHEGTIGELLKVLAEQRNPELSY